MGKTVHVDVGHLQFGCDTGRDFPVFTVCIGELTVFEMTAYNGIEQHGYRPFAARFVHKPPQIIVERRSRIGMPCRIGFGIVVTELDKHIIALLQPVEYGLPTSFVNKTLRAAAVHGVILDIDFLGEKTGQYEAPAPFGISARQVFIRHGRIADHIDRNFTIVLGSRKQKKTN